MKVKVSLAAISANILKHPQAAGIQIIIYFIKLTELSLHSGGPLKRKE